MTKNLSNWFVTGWARLTDPPPDKPSHWPVEIYVNFDDKVEKFTGPIDPKYRTAGAMIEDAVRGVEYRATVELDADGQVARDVETGKARLKSLEIYVTDDAQQIDNALLRAVPAQTIAETVAGQIVADASLGENKVVIDLRDPEDRKPPELEAFAKIWRATPEKKTIDGESLSRRHLLARHYHRSVRTIDGWMIEARKEGLLPESKVGPKSGRKRPNRKDK